MRYLALIAIFLLGGSNTGLAQDTDFLFEVDSNATIFDWDLTASIGNIVESPSNFSVSGATTGILGSPGFPYVSGALNGGGAMAIPNLSFHVPNPISWLPDLASGNVTGLEFRLQADVFTVDTATGNFTAIVEMVPFAGHATWSGILGSGNSLMAGSSSGPILSNGRFIPNGSNIIMELPIDASIPFPMGIVGRLWGTMYAVADTSLPNPPVLETALGLARGIWDNFTVRNAAPGNPVGLAASFSGQGATTVGPWGITLDISNAFQVSDIILADSNGTANWSLYIPTNVPMWKSVWLQGAMPGATTNIAGNFTY
ncbi:MAG TPA: hypothetical protein DDW23_02445 [Planctomycetes bacterium]|nr:hypothetical protein [Planctomycetota bacterium]